MASIITSILSSTVGLLWNKARDTTADKLKDGDVTDEKTREIVVRELNNIKTKIDGLSRKDLLSSCRFLKEGVDLLNVSLDKAKNQQNVLQSEIQFEPADRCETSTMASEVQFGILGEALELSQAMGRVKINSDKEYESAKKRFKDTRKTATHAFCNEALSIKDRIFAAKLRVVSEILECLENPDTAITGCVSFLQDLHRLPAIREIFSVYLSKGMMSVLNKAERVENVKSVMLINYVLFQFVSKFSSSYCSAYVWPAIELADRIFRPILNWQEVSTRKSWGEELIKPPNEIIPDVAVNPDYSAVNSRGEIVAMYGDDIRVISKTGVSKVVKLPDPTKGKVIQRRIAALAIDNNDNVYVVKWLKTRTENGDVKGLYWLQVLDDKYKHIKQDHTLDFLKTDQLIRIAINKNNDIIMIIKDDSRVFVCDNTGQLKHKFERESYRLHSLCTTESNEIMIPTDDLQAVLIYKEDGDLKFLIHLSRDYEVRWVEFRYVSRKTIVLAYNHGAGQSDILLLYSETGELEMSTSLYRDQFPSITFHPSGPLAYIKERSITFI